MANLSKIGRGTKIVGNIRGDGHVDIEGRIEGSLDIDGEVTLAESARVKSAVRGTRVVVRGAVAGDISASEAIVLEEGARVVGDLSAPSIGIRPGGLLRGHVSTDPALKKPARNERAASPRETREAPPPRESQPGRTTSSRTTSRIAEPPARKETPVKEDRRPEPPPRLLEPAPSPLTRPVVIAEAKSSRGAPAPVMPALQKGAKGALKKKGAR